MQGAVSRTLDVLVAAVFAMVSEKQGRRDTAGNKCDALDSDMSDACAAHADARTGCDGSRGQLSRWSPSRPVRRVRSLGCRPVLVTRSCFSSGHPAAGTKSAVNCPLAVGLGVKVREVRLLLR
jgi:hypothetical protein